MRSEKPNPIAAGDALWAAELQRLIAAFSIAKPKRDKALNERADIVIWLKYVCRMAVDFGGYRMAYVGFAEDIDEKLIRVVASAGFPAGHFDRLQLSWAKGPQERGPAARAIRTGKPNISRDIRDDPALTSWRGEVFRREHQSSVAFPLRSAGRTFGIWGMYNEVMDAFGPAEIEALQGVADELALGIRMVLGLRAERQLAAEYLADSEKKLALAQRIARLGHWEQDLKTNALKWSDEHFRIYGMKPKSTGFYFPEFAKRVHPEDWPRIQQEIGQAVRDGKHFDVEFRIIRPDGEIRYIHSEGDAYLDDTGNPVRTFGASQDITERFQAAAALANANRALEAKNIALQEVLSSVKAEQDKIGRQIAENVQKVIFPQLLSLKRSLDVGQQARIEQIERALEDVASPFVENVLRVSSGLTPMEVRVCDFVRRGLAVKEIAEMEHLSPQTVAVHRKNIRRKLGIAKKKINLISHLRTVYAQTPPQNA